MFTQSEAYLIKLLRSIKKVAPDINSDINWMEIYRLCSIHSIIPLLYPVVAEIKENGPPEELLSVWQKKAQINAVSQISMIETAYLAIKRLNDRGIETIALKGMFLRYLYPQPENRTMGDIDLFLADKNQREAAEKELMDMGFKYLKGNGLESSFKLHNTSIDMHFELFGYDYRTVLRPLKDENIILAQNSIVVNFDKKEIRILEHTQNLIYMMCHIIKHFMIAGVGLRQLVDITLFIDAYKQLIDWKRFWSVIKKVDGELFCVNFLNIAVKYFDLDTSVLEGLEKPDDAFTDTLLSDIFEGGTLGTSSAERGYAVSLSNSKIRGHKRDLFFPMHFTDEKFKYGERHKILLPIAWLHRIICYIISGNAKVALKGSKTAATKREKLIKDFKIDTWGRN